MRKSRRWLATVGALVTMGLGEILVMAQPSPRYVLRDQPDDVRFFTSDIDRFWQAFDEAATSSDAGSVYQSVYLRQGTVGLENYFASTGQNASSLANAVSEHPKYYRAIRENTLSIATASNLQAKIRRYLENIETLYPKAQFQDVYFLIGALVSGGTTSANGVLLGTEIMARDASTPVDELSPWLRANSGTLEQLPFIVVHEQIHTLQNVARGYANDESTLLWKVLQEGGADFVTMLATGERPPGSYFEYGLRNERAIWNMFEREMGGSDTRNWLYNGDNAPDGRPADLGYFVGYRILEAYYNRAQDKQQALEAMLTLRDAKALLRDSRYQAP
jgi:Predicted Zn-dependent protease (DUF2268)